jgi:hypothetical protein
MFSLLITLTGGGTTVNIRLGGGGGVMSIAYAVPFATFNCLAGFTLSVGGYYGGALQCYSGFQDIGFTPA